MPGGTSFEIPASGEPTRFRSLSGRRRLGFHAGKPHPAPDSGAALIQSGPPASRRGDGDLPKRRCGPLASKRWKGRGMICKSPTVRPTRKDRADGTGEAKDTLSGSSPSARSLQNKQLLGARSPYYFSRPSPKQVCGRHSGALIKGKLPGHTANLQHCFPP